MGLIFGAVNPPCIAFPQDCNLNGIQDDAEIASGQAQDCNSNGIPDECELVVGLGNVSVETILDAPVAGLLFPVGARTGAAIVSLPDYSSSGSADLLIGTPGEGSVIENAGALYRVSLDSSGSPQDATVILIPASVGPIEPGSRIGGSAVLLGDLNGDGLREVAVGAPGWSEYGQRAGAVLILTLDSAGAAQSATKIPAGVGAFASALTPGAGFGSSLAVVGDLDGNNVPDLLVGAPLSDVHGDNSGAVFVVLLNPDGTVKDWIQIDGNEPAFGGAIHVGDRFGAALCSLGDQDGDGSVEVMIGAPGSDSPAENVGAVWAASIDSTGLVGSPSPVDFTGVLGPADGRVGNRLGSGLASLGDHDGNGIVDIAVGESGRDGASENEGAVHICLLTATGQVLSVTTLASLLGGFDQELSSGARLGMTIASAGDINGDGLKDLWVGAPMDDGPGDNAGSLWSIAFETSVLDCDGNGVLDECDLLQSGADCDNDGILDVCEVLTGSGIDCDNDGVLDSCEILADGSLDCDGDQGLDSCQIDLDPSLDWDGNGSIDDCLGNSPVYCTGNLNATGNIGRIAASGSPMIADNAFTLSSYDLPIGQPGYYLFSAFTANVNPFGGGAGVLCLGAPIRRLNHLAGYPVLFVNSSGEVSITLDLGNLPQTVLQPGDIYAFQLWHREFDITGNPTSNTTDAMRVMFR